MNREKITEMSKKLSKTILPQFLIQSIVIILTAVVSFLFMTWLVTGVLKITENAYAAAGLEALGTLIVFIIILVPLYTVLYRRRLRELTTLSDSIQRVAAGDYSVRIDCKRAGQITPVYEDFNKMCAELASVQILRNDFINSFSHEFKTPIASINGFASLLLEKKLSEEDQRQYLEIILEESSRLTKLSSNTILLSKLASQQIVTDMEWYDLSEQIRQCSIILSKYWLEKKIEFSGDFPETRFYGNKELMQHLWLNLIGNAVKFTSSGGEISVEVKPERETIQVLIADTGEGMDQHTLEYLFDPYFQGDSSHSGQGLGLGLSICSRITALCGGSISVQSKLGEGSCFTVTLPVKSEK
ncbi:MAG: HAMP domain-containing sensor histidine kinase [Lachnospiraceae bacterium]|nr:HAMP domain-containing sensor histidine kinase [Lachnospiraceae bacterium]